VSSEGPPELRKISDARTLRALAHPVRVALIEELTVYGAMTATEVGERIGETPTTCSFHLRQLAKYGFVEEAGGGKGRARPWRMTSIGMHISGEDPEAQIASDAVMRVFRERAFARYNEWQRTKALYPKAWRDAADNSDYLVYATPEELKGMNEDLHAVLMRFYERLENPAKRPPGALPVETLLLSFPIEPPAPAGDGEDE
jgi:DNA-binding transcriptional ArsR family regulator